MPALNCKMIGTVGQVVTWRQILLCVILSQYKMHVHTHYVN